MHRYFILSLVALLTVFALGCGKKATKEVGRGTINEGVYANEYLGIEITLPKEWSFQSDAMNDELLETGKEMIAGDDKAMKAVMKASESKTVSLFSAFKYPVGSPVESNPSIISAAENVAWEPGVTNGADFHFHAKKLLQQGQIPYTFPEEIYPETVGNIEFHVLKAKVALGPVTMTQEYYATKIKDYIFLLVTTYTTESEKAEIREILNTLTKAK